MKKQNPINQLKNPVAYEEMNEQQKRDMLLQSVKKELLSAIQFMSLAYRSPHILTALVDGVQDEIQKSRDEIPQEN